MRVFTCIEEVMVIVDSVLEIKKELDLKLDSHNAYVDTCRNLAVKYWSLLGTLAEAVYSVNEFKRERSKCSKNLFAKLINSEDGSEAKRERSAKNNSEYIEFQDLEKRIELYLDYLNNLRSDIEKAYYLCKTFFEVNATLHLATPRTE